MKEVILPEKLVTELEDIYQRLQGEYSRVADSLKFTCSGCPDNCCDSYFLHHTYAEWAYLWQGVRKLEPAKQKELIKKATEYLTLCEEAMVAGERPQVMCPLNDEGLCALYKHRLLVCRTHGVPATLTRPDGQSLGFPGCFRCQDIVELEFPDGDSPSVERTAMLKKLAFLENELLEGKRHRLPRVKMTIAEMLVKGPPTLPLAHCERKTT